MEETLIRLVQAGFHGVALAFLYLGYRLRKPLLSPNQQEEPSPNALQLLTVRLQSAERFLTIAIIFLVIGGGLEIARMVMLSTQEKHPHEVAFILQPGHMPNGVAPIRISKNGAAGIPFHQETGRADFTLEHKDGIQIMVHPLINKIDEQSKLVREALLATDMSHEEVGIAIAGEGI